MKNCNYRRVMLNITDNTPIHLVRPQTADCEESGDESRAGTSCSLASKLTQNMDQTET